MKKIAMKKRTVILLAVALTAVLAVTLGIGVSNCVAKQRKERERAEAIRAYRENKLSAYAEENAKADGFEVVFLGDSLTDGCDLARYYGEYSVTNRGIGGDTTSGLIERLQISAYDANPRVIVLLIGGNDILGGKSVEEVCANYETILKGIRQNLKDTEIVWCSQTVLGDEWAKHNGTVARCNQRIEALAAQFGCAFVDLYTPLCDPETGEIAAEYTVEGVHLTDAGYRVVSSAIKTQLRNLLGH